LDLDELDTPTMARGVPRKTSAKLLGYEPVLTREGSPAQTESCGCGTLPAFPQSESKAGDLLGDVAANDKYMAVTGNPKTGSGPPGGNSHIF
jgi:hypothetical protein